MKENKKRILITGIGGFLGSHALDHFLVNTDWEIIGIDSWRHKGVAERILDSEHYQNNKERVTIYTHDLTSPISPVLRDRIGYVDYILNLASESHVDRSITDPVPFMDNNIKVVVNMLEFARDIWGLRKVGEPNIPPEGAKFIQFSTDEVYGPMLNDYAHPEWDPILPSNPYSASKACQEAIAISYWRTYSLPLVITNTMNLIGEKQDGEKYLPKIVKNVKEGTSLTIHAKDGVAGSRFYLHCRNAADACMFIFKNVDLQMFPDFNEPVRLNVVGKTELNNLELALKVADIMGKELKYEFIDVHSVRPGHDPKYGLDGTKLRELGYEYPVDFDETLKRTVDWMIKPENAKFIEKL
jgi:dTDP-glucose 4,6-dehydratase